MTPFCNLFMEQPSYFENGSLGFSVVKNISIFFTLLHGVYCRAQ